MSGMVPFSHRHSVSERTRQIPFSRVPIPANPNPEPTTYAGYLGMLETLLAETGDDHEWLPNPSQHSVVGVLVTAEMVNGWLSALQEFDAILNGEKLVPFWLDKRQGVNLKRVFTEPREFDLVLWVQGTAAAPYLERGETTSPETWNRMLQVFRGEFIGFALWFN